MFSAAAGKAETKKGSVTNNAAEIDIKTYLFPSHNVFLIPRLSCLSRVKTRNYILLQRYAAEGGSADAARRSKAPPRATRGNLIKCLTSSSGIELVLIVFVMLLDADTEELAVENRRAEQAAEDDVRSATKDDSRPCRDSKYEHRMCQCW